jgi:hypothetical protein
MSFISGTATNVTDLLTILDAFLTKGHSLDPQYSAIGDGIITCLIGTASSILEVVTVDFADAADFSVSGSLSGSLGSGTVGVPFSCDVCEFTITAGATDWEDGDTIEFTMTPPWVQERFTTDAGTASSTSPTLYSCWKAPGNDGESAIYVAVRRIMDVTGDYDNLRLNGYIAYDPGLHFYAQPGGMTSRGPLLPLLRVGSMPYWIAANGRRVVIVVKTSTRYMSAYLGLITPYLNPSALPYPLLIGGCMAYSSAPSDTSTNWRWSATGTNISAFPKSAGGSTLENNTCRFRRPDGVMNAMSWISRYAGLSGGLLTPNSSIGLDLRAGLDGSYPILPVVLSEDAPSNVWGELDGVGYVSGHANTAENTVAQNRIQWLVVQDVGRTSKENYFAVKLA